MLAMETGNVRVNSVVELRRRLNDQSLPVAARMRTVFGLKELGRLGGSSSEGVKEEAILGLAEGMQKDGSALLKHEAAYALGQTQNPFAVRFLAETLATVDEDAMVRHEAAEALGAIATEECAEILEQYEKDEVDVVRETVEIALRRLTKITKERQVMPKHEVYQSVDPAPPVKGSRSVQELRNLLLNTALPLYERYEAMFGLRNICASESEAVLALCDGFGDSSPLFRHEIAYVLGQVQSSVSIPALSKVLLNRAEVPMVRHEAAEALGSVGTAECEEFLRDFLKDEADVVRESCEVALDITDYNTSDALHYTDTIVQ